MPLFDDNQASFRLSRIIVALNRGDVIASYPTRFRGKRGNYRCYYDKYDHTLEWGSGKVVSSSWASEYGRIFFDTMKGHGANVVGDTARLFGLTESAQAAEFLIGGRITSINGNVCYPSSFWRASLTGKSLAEFNMIVEWEMFSAMSRQVVYKFSTQGNARELTPIKHAVSKTFNNAFASAVDRLAEDEGFRKILTRKIEVTDTPQPAYRRLVIAGAPLYRTSLKKHIDNVRAAAVTIELGDSHGSGFLISREGYLLTNAHVVGEGKRVPVVFSGGVRAEGRVLRIARKRDVALVKVPVSADYVLPIAQHDEPKVADTVFALGTPMSRNLTGTLTKGIVSGYRNIGEELRIQADVPISPGNSGGPLLNVQGNVVGISVAHYIGGNSLDFFIPIDDALKQLNLSVEVE